MSYMKEQGLLYIITKIKMSNAGDTDIHLYYWIMYIREKINNVEYS